MRVKWTTETFIQKLMSIFGNDYVYDFTEYHGTHERVLIYCKKHGFFRSYASDLIRGHGCRKCSQAKSGLSRKDSFDDVVGKIKQRHGDKYRQ